MPRAATQSKDICFVLVETTKEAPFVSEDVIYYVRKIVQDKIFANRSDSFCVVRDDELMENDGFSTVNWNILKKLEENVRKPTESQNKMEIYESILHVKSLIDTEAENDVFEVKKCIVFALLKNDINRDAIKEIMDTFSEEGNIALSIIVPDEQDMNKLQLKNTRLIRDMFENEEYFKIGTYSTTRAQLLNLCTNREKKPYPWAVQLEIGPNIKIEVKGYVGTRRNKPADLKKAIVNENSDFIPESTQDSRALVSTNNDNDNPMPGPSSALATIPQNKDEEPKDFQYLKDVLHKEKIWVDNEGNQVDDDTTAQTYYYGDKMIPIYMFDDKELYDAGGKCFRVLFFTQRSNIHYTFLSGDGTTLFYPKTPDTVSERLFDSLYQSLLKTDRVAIVRKIYRKNTNPKAGILSPCVQLKCLIYTEICFSDGISIPQFDKLIKDKQKHIQNDGMTDKDELIDKLIASKSLRPGEKFTPFEGPVDPHVVNMREETSRKIAPRNISALPNYLKDKEDPINEFFNYPEIDNDVVTQFKIEFPVKENDKAIAGERPAGDKVFRKRHNENGNEGGDEKKVKVEAASEETKEPEEAVEGAEKDNEEDLMDEL